MGTGATAEEQAGELARSAIADHNDEAVIARIGATPMSEGIFLPLAEIREHLEKFGAATARALGSDDAESA
jgi:hypothetical protein